MSLRNKKLIILGSRGMLGQMVKQYFSPKTEVICYDERYTVENRKSYTDFLRSLHNAIVINCIGKIKQKTDDANDLLFVNAILPADLRNVLHPGVILIHPSTDCVFDGLRGEPYKTNDSADATDEYGWSKRLGEVTLIGRANTLIPRVSIIGPDANKNGKGLMAWVFSQKGNLVKGFENHLWNGITTLEWCKQIESFLELNTSFDFRLVQFGTTEHHTKLQMLQLFNDVFDLNLNIEAFNTPVPVDRRLQPDVYTKSLAEQLGDIKQLSNG